MRLYIIRHGQTAWNLQGRAQGHVDIPLDEVGLEQARQAGRAFADTHLTKVISSDLARASETAKSIAEAAGCVMETTPELRERSFGEWEGTDYTLLREKIVSSAESQKVIEHDFAPPGGESASDLFVRLSRFAESLNTVHGDIAIVTHGGACAQLLAALVHGDVHTARSFRFENTAITELHRRPDGLWTLVRYGDTRHLEIPSAPMIDVVPTS